MRRPCARISQLEKLIRCHVKGCDFCGIVEEIGDKVTAKVKKGDRIAGMVHGSNMVCIRDLYPYHPSKLFAANLPLQTNHEDGCFAEYCVVKDGIFLHPPSSMSSEEAATLGVGVTTVGQSLYQSLGLPLPTKPASTPFSILIYGGSTATGALAIQYAKLSGAYVITTASARNHSYLQSLGADACFDYREPDCAAKIRDHAPELRLALDNIASEASARICGDSLAPSTETQKSTITFLLPQEPPREDIEAKRTLGYTAMGEAFEFRGGMQVPVEEGHWEFARDFWSMSQGLFEQGKVKVHRPEVRKGGLEGVLQGLGDLREDKVSGVKLVYTL